MGLPAGDDGAEALGELPPVVGLESLLKPPKPARKLFEGPGPGDGAGNMLTKPPPEGGGAGLLPLLKLLKNDGLPPLPPKAVGGVGLLPLPPKAVGGVGLRPLPLPPLLKPAKPVKNPPEASPGAGAGAANCNLH
jgi:hypothetical protein